VWASGSRGFVEAIKGVVTDNPGASLMLWDYPQRRDPKLGVGKNIFGRQDGPVVFPDHVCEFFSYEVAVVASRAVRASHEDFLFVFLCP
jgi:hypothetical protein